MAIFNTLGHLALRVNDLDASLAFYGALGFPEFLRLLNAKGEPWIVYLRITDEVYLELFPGGDGQPVPEPERTGLMHLCLTVDDIEKAEAQLKAAGVELMHPRSDKRGLDRNRGMWVKDPDGRQIEIMEMAPNCIQAEALKSLHAGTGPLAMSLY